VAVRNGKLYDRFRFFDDHGRARIREEVNGLPVAKEDWIEDAARASAS